MDEGNPGRPDLSAGTDPIAALVADLASRNRSVRLGARRSLILSGPRASAALVGALGDPRWQVRWEAAMALREIADPEAAPALVGALGDRNSSVRWLASEGLIALGGQGLAALLQALVEHSDSFILREGAHHVLHHFEQHGAAARREALRPLLAALEDAEPVLGVPPAAAALLRELGGGLRPSDPES